MTDNDIHSVSKIFATAIIKITFMSDHVNKQKRELFFEPQCTIMIRAISR